MNTADDSIISINGGRAKTNGILIDGVPASAGFGDELMTYIPTVDATQEFKVQSSNLPAQFGRLSGGVINVTTRSGTNQFHGTLFEFFRNTSLNANELFNKTAGQAVPAFHMNQFGFALGGPVSIPKIYRGKDRTFFFTDYQATKWIQNSTFLTTIPTTAQRSGDFTQTRTAAGALVPIYNPFTTRVNPAAPSTFIRDPFTGNVIPASLINPIAAKMLTYVPTANTAGVANTVANNFISGAPRTIDQGNFDFRLDHYVSERERLFGRFGGLRSTLGQPDYFGNVATPGVACVLGIYT